MNCKLIIVDGALNRLAPMIETNGIILATGAARNTDIDVIVQETENFCYIFNLSKVNSEEMKLISDKRGITLFPLNQNSKIITIEYSSLIDRKTVEKIRSNINDTKIIFIPALLSALKLKELNQSLKSLWKNKTLIINDSIKIIAGGNLKSVFRQIKEIENFGGNIKVFKKIPILSVTVNPYYPYFDAGKYRVEYVDREKLLFKMKSKLPVPVVDVMKEGPMEIVSVILNKLV